MLESYLEKARKRQHQNLPPLPLTAEQTRGVTELLEKDHEKGSVLLEQIELFIKLYLFRNGETANKRYPKSIRNKK